MRNYYAKDLAEMDKRFRANFINSISGFKSANLIGSVNSDGITNLAIFSSVVHIGANPPLLGFILRPLSVDRHSYSNIIEKGYFTINALPFSMKEDGHLTSAKFPVDLSEFDKTKFTPEQNEFGLPYVKESQVAMTCQLKSDTLIELNDTRLIIGQVVHVRVNPEHLKPDGFFDSAAAGGSTISGMDSYHSVNGGVRFNYARPNEEITALPK